MTASSSGSRQPDPNTAVGLRASASCTPSTSTPEAWGRGLGRALLRDVTAELVGLGYREAVLWVVPQNDRARRFYESEGWRDDHVRRDDEVFGVVVPEMRYRRRLPGGGPGVRTRRATVTGHRSLVDGQLFDRCPRSSVTGHREEPPGEVLPCGAGGRVGPGSRRNWLMRAA